MSYVTHTFTAPACWAPYWINSDASGLDEAEIAAADKAFDSIQRRTGSTSPHPCACEDVGFMSRPDFGGAGDCCEYSFLVESRK